MSALNTAFVSLVNRLYEASSISVGKEHAKEKKPEANKSSLDEKTVLDLAAGLEEIASDYKFTLRNKLHTEQFTFTTDRKQKYLVIDKQDPRYVKYISFGAFPWHVAFGRQIAKSGSGTHRWYIHTNKTTDYLKVGIYFAQNIKNFTSDFGLGRMSAGAGTYFAGRCRHIAGIDYRTGSVFGGKAAKIGKIGAGDLNLDFDTRSAVITFRVAHRSATFNVEELVKLNELKCNWEAVLWVAIGSGGPRMDHDARITDYQVIPPAKL